MNEAASSNRDRHSVKRPFWRLGTAIGLVALFSSVVLYYVVIQADFGANAPPTKLVSGQVEYAKPNSLECDYLLIKLRGVPTEFDYFPYDGRVAEALTPGSTTQLLVGPVWGGRGDTHVWQVEVNGSMVISKESRVAEKRSDARLGKIMASCAIFLFLNLIPVLYLYSRFKDVGSNASH